MSKEEGKGFFVSELQFNLEKAEGIRAAFRHGAGGGTEGTLGKDHGRPKTFKVHSSRTKA